MSYTPPDQEINKFLLQTLDGLEGLRAAMLKRLLHSDWSSSHKEDLRTAVTQITEVQMTLAKFV